MRSLCICIATGILSTRLEWRNGTCPDTSALIFVDIVLNIDKLPILPRKATS